MKNRSSKRVTALLVPLLVLGLASSAMAVPSLQLDILGGTYNTTTETIVSSSSTFGLYSYLTLPNNGSNTLADTYYLSIALTPQTKTAGNYGSIKINGNTIDITSDMVYGTAPLNDPSGVGADPHDLAGHGIFDTYYTQIDFTFDANNYISSYNTQDVRLSSLPGYSSGDEKMYYYGFTVDTSNLDPNYQVHFDLYNENLISTTSNTNVIVGYTKNGKPIYQTSTAYTLADVDVNNFAPFSHDAESGSKKVPEPGTIRLLGAGLLGLGLINRKKFF
jgi:hypothetical protein